MNFCLDSLLWTKHGSITSHPRRSQNNELHPVPKKVNHKVGRKGNSHSFLKCMRYYSYRLSSVEAYDQWRLLRSQLLLIGPFQQCFLKKKRSHLAKKKVFFHQDNAQVHTCLAPMTKFNKFRYELLPHPSYSPDLVPCNYFLFS